MRLLNVVNNPLDTIFVRHVHDDGDEFSPLEAKSLRCSVDARARFQDFEAPACDVDYSPIGSQDLSIHFTIR